MIVYKLLFIFAFFSITGWILEVIYRSTRSKNLVNPGFMSGCVVPIYGLGALILYLVCQFLPQPNSILNIIIIFFTCSILLTSLELFSGYTNLKWYNLRLWDYREDKFNFKGFICLKFAIYWGIISVLYSMFIYPNIDFIISTYFSKSYSLFFLGMFYGIFVIDLFVSIQLSMKFHKYASILKDAMNLEKIKLDAILNDKKNIIKHIYPYVSINQFIKNKVSEVKNEKKDK